MKTIAEHRNLSQETTDAVADCFTSIRINVKSDCFLSSSTERKGSENPYTTVRTRGMKVVAVDEAQKNTSMESQPPQWSEDHIVVSTYPKVN
jgi:hypothetical protein